MINIFTIILGSLSCISPLALALSPAQWRQQSIYQIVTDRFASPLSNPPSCSGQDQLNLYCNGTFQGVINKLDYIQSMGFTAVWISPVVQNIEGGSPNGYTPDGSAYHGYWAQNIYNINPHFGGAGDLVKLSKALHSRGMYLMVDVVVNHMGYFCGTAQNGKCGPQGSIDYSIYTPFNSESYFHPFCEIDYNNRTSILDCWEGDEIVPLPDLRTENSSVQTLFNKWITGLVKNFTIDGLRIDSLQQSGSSFFPSFWAATGNMYMVGEVFNGSPSYVCPYQQSGMPGVLNYPMFYYITEAFQTSTGDMHALARGLSYVRNNCSDSTLLGSFLENQDNPRFPSLTGDITRAMNAIAFTILQDGIPILYYGQEQHLSGSDVPLNREALWSSGGYNTQSPLYQMITRVNAIRHQAIKSHSDFVAYKMQAPYYDANTIVTRKGATGYQIIGVYSNLGQSGKSYNLSLSSTVTGFTANQKIIEVLTCTMLQTDAHGSLAVPMGVGQPRVLFPSLAVGNITICTNSSLPRTSTTSPQNCSSANVTFQILVNTTYGENVVVAGNIPALGNWNVASALSLSASNYTSKNPLWFGTAHGIDPGQTFEWKPVIVKQDGSDVYSPGANLQATAPTGCNATETLKYTFTGQ